MHITTFGHRIAAARDDSTVVIYDSVTGTLGLSLSPADPIQAIGGAPDGSVLFCSHQPPSVTLWDIQTGGLIHTFVLGCEAEHITISLKGRYLAYGLSDGSIKFSEVANKTEGTVVGSGSQVTHFCWVEPEGRIAFTKEESLYICDVASGEVLRSFTMGHPIHAIVHSQKSHQLVIVTNSGDKSAVKTINYSRGTSSAWYWATQRFFHFALSQPTDELVCGAEDPTLELFKISNLTWRCFEHPAINGLVFPLPSGLVIANGGSADIQLLSLDERYSLHRTTQLGPSVSTAYIFDQRKIIAILRPGRGMTWVESTSASVLLTIHTSHIHMVPVCASLESQMAVYLFGEGGKTYLQSWGFGKPLSTWTAELTGSPLVIGGISPFGTRLVTFHDDAHQTQICVWDARGGRRLAQLLVEQSHLTPPLEIRFESEGRFYSLHNAYHVPYDLTLQGDAYKILRHEQQPQLVERLPEGPYRVDDNMEWVVCGSKRVFWIPPGYIKSGQPSCSWAGATLVMYGQDGTSRVLTFRS